MLADDNTIAGGYAAAGPIGSFVEQFSCANWQESQRRINAHLHVLDQAWPIIQAHEALRCYTAPMLRWLGIYGGDPSWFDLSQFANLETFAQAYERTRPAVRLAEAEGLGQTPFSNPSLPNPPEGSAL